MNQPQRGLLSRTLVIALGLAGCSKTLVQPPPSVPPPAPASAPAPPPQAPQPLPTFRGVATYDDGTAASEALIAVTSLASGTEVAVLTADRDGRFETTLEPGEYALAVTTERGFNHVEPTRVPDLEATITLSRTCRVVTGRVKGSGAGARISLAKRSQYTGDVFLGDVGADGSFSLCLPDGHYRAVLRGPIVSMSTSLDLTTNPSSATAAFEIEGIAASVIEQPPREVEHVPAELDGLIADILRSDARLIGLGEATHGTAELTSSRATLTFELIRRADVRLVLVEIDAIVATALDDYVMGGDVDLAKALPALGFWITDTHEFAQFLKDLRAYNATVRNKVRVWGMDVQNTKDPVAVLLANRRTLKLTASDKAMLEALAEKRGAPVRDFAPARRAALDALLARLTKPRGTSQSALRIAVAARSLTVQVGYLDGNRALVGARRDAGMASLSSFLVAHTRTPRAVVWAHAGHISREADGGVPAMGKHLAAVPAHRYYPIGFYQYEGSVRAWDAAGAIGVISHPIPRAAGYMVEGAVMTATRSPDVAWLPIHSLPPALRTWFEIPRYVREVGALYYDEKDMLTLRDVPAEFDALVVIRTGHDSSPTPTGIRKVDK